VYVCVCIELLKSPSKCTDSNLFTISLYILILSYLFRLYIGDHQGESPLQDMRMTYVYCTVLYS